MSKDNGGSIFELLFGSYRNGSGCTQREEKVLRYIIHRVKHDVSIEEAMREEYVRQNATTAELDEILHNPELIHAAREHLEETFESEELAPSKARRSS